MVQTIINLKVHQDRILNIVKGKYGFRNKSDAVNFIIEKFEEGFIEPELRPEYIEKIKTLEKKNKFTHYQDLSSLRKDVEHA